MNTCPCCSNSLLRHIQHHQVYWFCRTCWQEMPAINPEVAGSITHAFTQPSIAILPYAELGGFHALQMN